MDNQNDPNSPNNPNYPPASEPVPSSGTPIQPFPDLGNLSESSPTPTQSEPTPPPPLTNSGPSPSGSMMDGSMSSWPPPSDPTPPTTEPPSPMPQGQGENPPISTWPSDPIQSSPNPLPQDQPSAWAPPTQTVPQPQPQPTAELNPPPSGAGPTPTFTPPPPATAPSGTEPDGLSQQTGGSEPPLSPLDNPWGAPAQPPPIEQPQPTTQPSWTNIPTENQTPNPPPPTPLEAAPTDLSHLISNNQPEQATPPTSETLVVPSAVTPAPEVPTLPTENHKSIPKWLIGLGVGLLVLVGGASAYFILGIGQPSKTTSLPAATAPAENTVKPPPPITTPTAQPSEQPVAASGSANFGELQGGGSQQATSAAELLRQRQGR